MKWLIFYKLIYGKLEPVYYGSNIVPDDVYDKVIPVREEVARQAHKFDFDGTNLTLKENATFLTLEELNAQQQEIDEENGIVDEGTNKSSEEIIVEPTF